MVNNKRELLLYAEDIWRKARARFGPPSIKLQQQQQKNQTNKSKMPENPTVASSIGIVAPSSLNTSPPPTATPGSELTTTATSTTATTASASNGSNNNNGNSNNASSATTKKRCWRRRTVHFTVFLAVFSTILSLLWVYTLTAELRRSAFDVNMKNDRVIVTSMDNPNLVSFIRDFKLTSTLGQEQHNTTQTPEEQFVANQLQSKRNGVYFEYMSRIGAQSTTAWLEANLSWHGVMVFTDPRCYADARKSSRSAKTRVVQACLSTDRDTREITYHQETDVQVTKLDEASPNSLVFSKESPPATRLICFPLYTILLAYNTTTLNYVHLDSSEIQDGLILDTIPWDVIRISVLSIHWSGHHSDSETRGIIDKLVSHNYKYVKNLSTGKLVFVYNPQLKI